MGKVDAFYGSLFCGWLARAPRTNLSKAVKIMVSGYSSSDVAEQSLEQGADAYVVKPVAPAALLKLMDEKLRDRASKKKRSYQISYYAP